MFSELKHFESQKQSEHSQDQFTKQQNLKLKLDILKIKEKNKRLRTNLSPKDKGMYSTQEVF